MKHGKSLLTMVVGFAAGTMLGALFVNKKRPKDTKEEQQKDKSGNSIC